MPDKTQIVFIDGGMTFKNREDYLKFLETREVSLKEDKTWNEGEYLENSLENEVARIDMPCRKNAKYQEWKITFEKYLPKLSDNITIVGLSLGGTFLAKYLSENKIPKSIVSTYLIAPPYDDDLEGEDLAGGFELNSGLSLLEKNCDNLTLMFSKEDDVVPIRHADKFRKELSGAEIIEYESKEGHFQTQKFPELVQKINKDLER